MHVKRQEIHEIVIIRMFNETSIILISIYQKEMNNRVPKVLKV